ncbi:hypothetical protein [Saccharothrix australiensis]|uniref:hypothetical protein n=1 Tax=Saccharothrix australiensis TaxID=2072 RepID=UPI0011C38830|nr:hypothetical protein [Saccharothrix australiensis]
MPGVGVGMGRGRAGRAAIPLCAATSPPGRAMHRPVGPSVPRVDAHAGPSPARPPVPAHPAATTTRRERVNRGRHVGDAPRTGRSGAPARTTT